jgi:hypothetical protein
MKSHWAVLATAPALLLCAACASAPEQASEHRVAKVYMTGSNIPVRDRSRMSEVQTVDPESLHQELNGATRPSPVGGVGR